MCGGRGLNSCVHNSVEEYLPDTDVWMLVEPMTTSRANYPHKPSALCERIVSVQMYNSLLVLGGSQPRDGLNGPIPGEMLNLETGTWQRSEEVSCLSTLRIYEAVVVDSKM